jgi:hypothetical protein
MYVLSQLLVPSGLLQAILITLAPKTMAEAATA